MKVFEILLGSAAKDDSSFDVIQLKRFTVFGFFQFGFNFNSLSQGRLGNFNLQGSVSGFVHQLPVLSFFFQVPALELICISIAML